MKRDWESYFNKPNKHGVVVRDWEIKNENHTRYSAVICLCPVCEKEFICYSGIYRIINDTKEQIKMCPQCSNNNKGKNKMLILEDGSIFENVKVIEPAGIIKDINGKGFSCSVCECLLCGTIFTTRNGDLKNGKVKSCGCVSSFGEYKTQIELNKYNIETSKQYTFYDLRSSNGGCLRFDFAIHKNNILIALIEFQGIQHFQINNSIGKQQREETDALKKEYCKAHDIPLYEIRFNEDVETKVNEILTELNLIKEAI